MVGDAKTYNHPVELKRSYGQELSLLLPLPGDWHILENFQLVLFKAYYDAGLKQIAEVWFSPKHAYSPFTMFKL